MIGKITSNLTDHCPKKLEKNSHSPVKLKCIKCIIDFEVVSVKRRSIFVFSFNAVSRKDCVLLFTHM